MDKHLSIRIKSLSESQTIAMSAKSREMKQNGIDVISLSLGEPDFNTPEFIKEAAIEAINEDYSHYPPVPGYLELRQVISAKFKRDNNLNYSAEQIVVSTGAKQSLANVILSLVNEGDEVILPTPYWVSYLELIKLAGGVPVFVPSSIENEFKIRPEQLKNAITEKSKLMIFSSPCNPSGAVYSQAELEGLKNVIVQHPGFFVISDEIYEMINFESKHTSLASFDDIYNQVITVNGVSKGFAMTGWRVGYIGAPTWIAKACTKMQGQFTSATSGISQKAAQAGIEADPKQVEHMKITFKKRRDLMLKLLNEIEGIDCAIPTGAFYLFPDISFYFGKSYQGRPIQNAGDLCMFLLEEGRVALVTGEAFGNPECVRISYAASDSELIEAVSRIKNTLALLK
ncbi:MAG: aspartate aminotransferase [Crocinitomicaceae bacterium]|nr:aspartate aminotransferase [Crocinitomicaceae bacterium]|tara:strand:+ start:20277 stop:21473 length:1197 start_codon:yes stop_codon:yes gene_type:complete